MIVTIDGPAGAGKSTVAKALARRLGFRYLDTGAMYRAVALAGLRCGDEWDRPAVLAALARRLRIELSGERIFLDGEDVTEAVRTSEVTAATRHAADHPEVRQRLVGLQRAAAVGQDIVTEGRDQGTVAFPEAQCKIFLTASPEERAWRRVADLQAQGEPADFEQVLVRITQRDREDASRPVGALRRAADAVELSTDGLTPDEVVDRLEAIVAARRPRQ
jgi:cytidylate kinase